MAKSVFTWSRIVAFALVLQQRAFAQNCYYPNGNPAPDSEKPCSSADGSACCPDTWQCLDNGLCYNDAAKIYGRYSCTDKDWKSSGCPSNLCTYDMSAAGAEAITQCSDHNNQWCCDANRVDVDCCKQSPEPRPFFDLGDGQQYAIIGKSTANDVPNLASITGSATGGGGDNNSPSSTPPPSSAASSSNGSPDSTTKNSPSSAKATPTGPTTPMTSLQTSVTSGSNGVETVVKTVVSTPPPVASSDSEPSPSDSSESKSKTPIIVGCAVGVPLGIALIGILGWLLRKHSQQKKAPPYSETPDPYSGSPEFAGGAKLHKNGATRYKSEHDPNVPELASQSVGPGRPISTIKGRAELESGGGFVPGATPHAPHLVGVGGGNGYGTSHTPQSSWGSAPPGYSPGQNQNAWTPAHAQQPSVGSMQDGAPPAAPAAPAAAAAAAAAPQTGGGRYIPYRPPPEHAAHQQGGLQNVPEMAELSGVRTPPAAAEMPATQGTQPGQFPYGR